MNCVHTLFWYRGRAEAMLKAFKYRGRWPLAATVAAMIIRRAEAMAWPEFRNVDLLIPMPMSDRAFADRGYHQTALVAAELAKRQGLQYSNRILSTRGTSCAQASLSSIEERERNVRGIFRTNSRLLFEKRVLLLDDVLTTGATLSSAAEALLAGGARSVRAITICRAPAFFDYRSSILQQLSELE